MAGVTECELMRAVDRDVLAAGDEAGFDLAWGVEPEGVGPAKDARLRFEGETADKAAKIGGGGIRSREVGFEMELARIGRRIGTKDRRRIVGAVLLLLSVDERERMAKAAGSKMGVAFGREIGRVVFGHSNLGDHRMSVDVEDKIADVVVIMVFRVVTAFGREFPSVAAGITRANDPDAKAGQKGSGFF